MKRTIPSLIIAGIGVALGLCFAASRPRFDQDPPLLQSDFQVSAGNGLVYNTETGQLDMSIDLLAVSTTFDETQSQLAWADPSGRTVKSPAHAVMSDLIDGSTIKQNGSTKKIYADLSVSINDSLAVDGSGDVGLSANSLLGYASTMIPGVWARGVPVGMGSLDPGIQPTEVLVVYDLSATEYNRLLYDSSHGHFVRYQTLPSSTQNGDYLVYLYPASKYPVVEITIGTGATYTGDAITWEYYNGSTWSAATTVADLTASVTTQEFDRPWTKSGMQTFLWPTNSAELTITTYGGVDLVGYAIRARVTDATKLGTLATASAFGGVYPPAQIQFPRRTSLWTTFLKVCDPSYVAPTGGDVAATFVFYDPRTGTVLDNGGTPWAFGADSSRFICTEAFYLPIGSSWTIIPITVSSTSAPSLVQADFWTAYEY